MNAHAKINPRLEAALYAADRGFRVFRVEAEKKKPAATGWQAEATTDPEQIRNWFIRGRYNVGIATGPMADGRWVVVVDFDCKKGKQGLVSLEMMQALDLLPATLMVRTPSGGIHLYFEVPFDCGLTLSEGKLSDFPDVDVRCDTALVVGPGSIFEGNEYTWANDLPLAPAPDALVELLLSGQGRKRTVVSRDPLVAYDTPEGIERARWFLQHEAESAFENAGGNGATYRVAATVRDFAISPSLSLELIDDLWNSDEDRVSPPWPAEELQQIIGNVFEYAKNPAGVRLAGAEFEAVGVDEPRKKRTLIVPSPFVFRPPNTIPPRQWLYGRHLSRGFISATVAHPGVGKTTVATVDALACVSGRNLIGSAPSGKLRVWYWNGEDPREEMERRFHAAMILHGLTAADLDDRLFLNSGRDDPITIARQTRDGISLAVPEVENMVAVLKEHRIDVIIIDPFISSHRVTENDNNAVDLVVKGWAAIADRAGSAADLVHHLRKTNGAEGTVEDARGASALIAAVRSARVLNGMAKEEAKRLGLENHYEFLRVGNGKASMSRRLPLEKEPWLRLHSMPLGNGDDVGAVAEWIPPDPIAELQPSDLLSVQQVIAAGDWRKDVQAKTWVGHAIADALGLDMTEVVDKARVKALLKVWLADGSLVEAKGLDQNRVERPFIRVGKGANQ